MLQDPIWGYAQYDPVQDCLANNLGCFAVCARWALAPPHRNDCWAGVHRASAVSLCLAEHSCTCMCTCQILSLPPGRLVLNASAATMLDSTWPDGLHLQCFSACHATDVPDMTSFLCFRAFAVAVPAAAAGGLRGSRSLIPEAAWNLQALGHGMGAKQAHSAR